MHPQSIIDPAGIQAQTIDTLWQVMLWVTTVVWVVVMVALALALKRASSRSAPWPVSTGRLHGSIAAATGLTVVILLGLLVASVAAGRQIQDLDEANALRVSVVGNQWWWHVQYEDADPSKRVALANELHLPRGRTVVLSLGSNDVIHSFWVPNLSGKIDLIPGRTNRLKLRADQNGIFRGQCGEFCGLQHAHMSLFVVVEDPDRYEEWITRQRQPSPGPKDVSAQRGLALFEGGSCAMCHAVRGTTAGGRTAPDLTHFASRNSIAAGTLPNTPEALDDWLQDPQWIKPGNRMPLLGLSPEDRRDLVAYLRTLG